jgi:diguanylate cyclase (GGDEF)-like protein/PAS domain S-box-containing protein
VFSFRDISRQAEVQAGLRLAARVFESSLDAIFIADEQHAVARINPGCERLLGADAQALVGRPAQSLLCPNDEADAFMARVADGWARRGFWEGELALARQDGSRCAVQLSWVALRDDAGAITQSIGFMRDLTSQHAAQRRIEELAYRDVLTGLPNRLLLGQRVMAAIDGVSTRGGGFAILFLDLDRFKIINDSMGHPFGDRVLQLVARRLQDCLRQSDMLCRLGGDEFVIYLHDADAVVAEAVARRVLDEMASPFMLDELGFSIQCSIGMALYPRDGMTLDDLIKQADTAMYRVKERGRGSYGFYQPQMNAHLLSRMKMEHAMRQALGQGHMAVHYQPQVGMADGRIVGAEALVRWTDPELGAVSPSVFIPLAEESGYIVTLGAWVMEQAIREAARWRRCGVPLPVSVNVSALEFRQPGFVERVTGLLDECGLPPDQLELELTETILLQDALEMEQLLHALSQLGVRLSIDDFGTGYSSLAYLKKLDIHKLKIDKSFVSGLPGDEGDRAIVRAIASMGRALRIEVLAEGVETEQQRLALREMDCDCYQGFLCAPALPMADFRALLARQWGASGLLAGDEV